MWLVFAGMNWDKVPDGASEYAHSGGEVGIAIRRIAVLKYGTLEHVGVKRTIWVSVVSDQSLYGFYSDFGAAVAVGVANR